MLSLGSREDGREGIGLRVRMEENELEEGEACSDQEDGMAVDPDALTYIDERIKDVLGHFQKEFESNLCIENLGVKFGIYGSFLPSPCSPAISTQPRSPQMSANDTILRSTTNPKFESSSIPTNLSAPPSEFSCISIKQPSAHTEKHDLRGSLSNAPDSCPRLCSSNINVNENDNKTLKVRIKVGSENTVVKNNADIYSGPGLDLSPSSSSPEANPNGGFSFEVCDAVDGSPSAFFQFYSSFCAPILVAYLLSPMPESWLHVMEKKSMHLEDCTMKENAKESLVKGRNYVEKNSKFSDIKFVNEKDGKCDTFSITKKEVDFENPKGKKLYSCPLDTQILSKCANGSAELPTKDADILKGSDWIMEDNLSPESMKEQLLAPIAHKVNRRADTSLSKGNITVNAISTVKDKQDVKTDVPDDVLKDRKKFSKNSADKSCYQSSCKSEGGQGLMPYPVPPIESVKPKVSRSISPLDISGGKSLHGNGVSSPSKIKSKVEHAGDASNVELFKDDAHSASRESSKEKKRSLHSKDEPFESKSITLQSIQEPNRSFSGENHINNVGLVNSLYGEYKAIAPGNMHKNEPEDTKLNCPKHDVTEKLKYIAGHKTAASLSALDAFDEPSKDTSLVSTSGLVTMPTAPVLEDNWVCCDKCQKWRLLPHGTDPNFLPKKWLCSMQTWLPGMNKCCFSEDETIAAFNVQYHLPLPDTQVALNTHNEIATSGLKDATSHSVRPTFEPTYSDKQCISKKKHMARNAPQDHDQLALGQATNSPKEMLSTSTKSRSLNEVNRYSQELDLQVKSGLQCTSKSADFSLENQKLKLKEKKNSLDIHATEGDFIEPKSKKSKFRKKRPFTGDNPGDFKKTKSGDPPSADADQFNFASNGKSAPEFSGDLSGKVSHRNILPQKDCETAKDIGLDQERLGKKVKMPVLAFPIDEMHDCRSNFANGHSENLKKRKIKESQKTQLRQGCDKGDAGLGFQEANNTLQKKEKKVRDCKPDETKRNSSNLEPKQGNSSSMMGILVPSSTDLLAKRIEGQGDGCKAHVAHRNNDGFDSFKRDVGRQSNATTSSSSKISGSHRSKTKLERKGSPVESVSSSPFRKTNSFKVASEISKGKSDTINAGFSSIASPKQKSHGVIEQIVWQKDDKTTRTAQIGIVESNKVLEHRDRAHMINVHKQVNHFIEGNTKDRLFANIFGNTDDEASPSHDDILRTRPEVASSSEQPGRCPDKPNSKDNHYQERYGPCNSSPNKELDKRLKSFTMRSKDEHTNKTEINDSKIKISSSYGDGEDICPRKDANGTDYYGQTVSREDLRNEYNYMDRDKKRLVTSEGKQLSDGKRNKYSSSRMQVNMETSITRVTPKVSDPGVGGNTILSSNGGDSNKLEGIRKPSIMQNEKRSHKPHKPLVDRADNLETKSGRMTSEPPSDLGNNREDAQNQVSRLPAPKGSQREAEPVEAVNNDNLGVITEHSKFENQNGRHNSSSRHTTPNGVDAPTGAIKGGKQSAANVIKEARDLKHSANRLKEGGLGAESTSLYFQAALKFLYGASLMELPNIEGIKQGNTASSIQIYSETAKLCEFCALAYENHKEMAAAALAYKCMEVAYLKVVYSKHTGAMKDCRELQTALPIGESPSSSASDVDNPNNLVKLNRVVLDNATSPQVVGNLIIAARNRPSFDQILAFAGYVNSAMEASRKSLNAFASASSGPVNRQSSEEMLSVRRVLDLSFHDVEGLLRLVRLSMELISK